MLRQSIRSGLAILLMLGAAPLASGQSQGVVWRTDLDAARAEAKQTGKLVLAHFWTESCGPCKKLEANVFAQPSVGLAISNEYIPVKINAELSPEIAQAYGVMRVPTDAVVTPDGQLVKAFVSPQTPMDYIGVVSRLAAAYKAQIGRGYNAVAATAPVQNHLQQATQQQQAAAPVAPAFNEAYAQLMAAHSPAAAVAPTQQPVAPPQAATPPTANPYAKQASVPAAPVPVTQAPSVVQNPATQVSAAAPPQVRQSVPVTPEIPAKPEPVVAAAVQLPAGSPPLGFEGYCPVTLKAENRWAAGDVRFGAIHRGRTYLFSSAEAQRQFLTSPDTYSPVLSGADPVVAVDERRSVIGSRDFGVEYPASGGRFYLFSSEESLEKFWRDPSAYAQGAERVAALPTGDSFIR